MSIQPREEPEFQWLQDAITALVAGFWAMACAVVGVLFHTARAVFQYLSGDRQ